MPRKRKPFINKKKSSTYHLLHRSQRDAAEDDYVLWPDANNNPETDRIVLSNDFADVRKKIERAGLLDVDHEQYLKPIVGDGMFIDGKTGSVNRLEAAGMEGEEQPHRGSALAEENLLEVQRQFDSIPITTDCMDDDIAEALFAGDFEDVGLEELDDEFVFQAASEAEPVSDDGFDFDQHIQELMEKARRNREGDGENNFQHDQEDRNFFGGLEPLQEVDETALPLPSEEEKALCQKFHETLAQYDDDEGEDYDYPEELLQGMYEPNDAVVESALDEFLEQEKPEDILIPESASTRKKSGFGVLVGTQMVPAKELDGLEDNAPPPPLEEILLEADFSLSHPKMPPPPEDVLIDGKSYFSERERSRWDCETILTTYSNVDNNPATIDAASTRRRRRRRQQQANSQHIQLSNKTGLPILPSDDRKSNDMDDLDDDLAMSTTSGVNRGVARSKNETPEERKNRKLMIKKERELARIQKKMTKEAFGEEFRRRSVAVTDDIAGSTVFRLS